MKIGKLLLGALLFCSLVSLEGYAYDTETETLKDIKLINEEGFGKMSNRYAWSMAVFKGSLYVGTNNSKTPRVGKSLFFLGLPFRTDGVEVWKGDRDDNGVIMLRWRVKHF